VLDVAQREGAVPFDVPGVELTHAGPLCSFDAFLKPWARGQHCRGPGIAAGGADRV
jgi:hypothetical protein